MEYKTDNHNGAWFFCGNHIGVVCNAVAYQNDGKFGVLKELGDGHVKVHPKC